MLEETRRLLAEECRQRAEVQDTLRAIICERDEWGRPGDPVTRYTDTHRRTGGVIRLEATGERDESDSHRHKWVTRLRFGLLSSEGPNTRGAVEYLEAELRELASCPEAIEALARVRAQRMADMRAAEARPPEPEPFEPDQDVEVRVSDGWFPATFERREGPRFRVWVPHFGGYLTVERSYVRAVNRPSLGDVG